MDRTYLDQVDGTEGLGTAQDMVEIARFLDPSEAQMVKGMLDAAGVEAFLDGENANALYPGVFRAIVMVRQADEAAARSLLAQTDDEPVGADLYSL